MARTQLPLDLAKVEQLAEDGYTDMDIARQCGFSQDTLIRRKKDNADFAAAIQRGRERSHGIVANALFKQAKKGNVAAIVWYEKTRRGMSDRVETEQHGNVTLRILDDDADDSPPAPVSRATGDRA